MWLLPLFLIAYTVFFLTLYWKIDLSPIQWWIAAIIFTLLNLLDLHSTAISIKRLGFYEGNPVARWVIGRLGIRLAAYLKLIGFSFLIYCWRENSSVLLTAIVVFSIVVASNYIGLYVRKGASSGTN